MRREPDGPPPAPDPTVEPGWASHVRSRAGLPVPGVIVVGPGGRGMVVATGDPDVPRDVDWADGGPTHDGRWPVLAMERGVPDPPRWTELRRHHAQPQQPAGVGPRDLETLRDVMASLAAHDIGADQDVTLSTNVLGAAVVVLDAVISRVEVSDNYPRPADSGHPGRMDNQTLINRLEAMLELLRAGTFDASWFYVDPTPDGPGEPRTVHTVELDGDHAQAVLVNLRSLTRAFHTVERVNAEITPGRVLVEAIGGAGANGEHIVRGVAIILDPYARSVAAAFGVGPEGSDTTRYDLTLDYLDRLIDDPALASTHTDSSTAEPTEPAEAPADPSPDPSPTAGPAPDSGLAVRRNDDVPNPSPDPSQTAAVPAPAPAEQATGVGPDTEEGAAWNPDGTPTEPTAGTTADVGPDSSETSSGGSATGLQPDPTLPGQTPVEVSDQPLDATAGSETEADASAAESRRTRMDALEAELAALRAEDAGGGVAQVTSEEGVQVAAHVDPVPDGGQNLASGQGAGPSGDPAGGGYQTAANPNPDGM